MSTVLFSESTDITLHGMSSTEQNKATRTRSFRVISESADRLSAWVLLDFADTLHALGADEKDAKHFRLTVQSSPERGAHGLTAEWSVELPAEAGS
jgi:hypothetical protein